MFDVANLMHEARRQQRLLQGSVPVVCVLDPDGDLVEYLCSSSIPAALQQQLRANWNQPDHVLYR